eukprot:317643-Amphidinium_carterae.1
MSGSIDRALSPLSKRVELQHLREQRHDWLLNESPALGAPRPVMLLVLSRHVLKVTTLGTKRSRETIRRQE